MESKGTLHVKRNKEHINSYELELGENIIGRTSIKKPSTIVIDDDIKLSRQHFIITVSQNEDGTYNHVLQDNNSLNGTQVTSGKKKKKLSDNEIFPLQNEDIIIAGKNTSFEFLEDEMITSPIIDEKEPKPIIDGIIPVPTTKGGKTEHVMVSCNEISHIKADGNFAYLFVEGEEDRIIWANKNLKYFENLLRNEDYIFRINDSTIVNVKKVKSYNVEGKDGRVILENDKPFIVSRIIKDSFEEKYIKK